jgi:hypothetical protein
VCKYTAPLTFIVLLNAVLLIFPLNAYEQETSNSEWRAAYKQQLGIQPDAEPKEGEAVRFVLATVTHPEKLFTLGLYGVKKGDKIKMINLGNNQWRIKHYDSGLAITLSVFPPKNIKQE